MRDWGALAEQYPERFMLVGGRWWPILAGGKGGGGGTTVVEAPKPTEEEIEIQRQQLAQLKIQTNIATQQAEAFPAFLDLQKTQVRIAQRALELQEEGLSESAALQRAQVEFAKRGLELQEAVEPFVLQSLRITQAEGGGLRRMTEDEFVATLTPTERVAHENLRLALERETKALRGELPLSEAGQQRKLDDFRLFKEAMARGGNPITGDTPETAGATTTPGIQALSEFKKRYGLLEEAERRGELTQGSQLVLQRLGVTSDIGRREGVGLLEPFNRTIPSVPTISAPGFSLLQPDFAGVLQPLQFNRAQQLQANIATAQATTARRVASMQAAAQETAALYGLIGSVIGAGGGVAGAGIMASSRETKKDIRRATRREEDRMLEMTEDLKTKTFRYKGENGRAPKRMGLLAEEAPREIATPDRTGLDVGRMMGLLTGATRSLARRVERLERRN